MVSKIITLASHCRFLSQIYENKTNRHNENEMFREISN